MSLVDQSVPLREDIPLGHTQQQVKTSADSAPRTQDSAYTPSSETYDHSIFDAFYMEDDSDVVAPSPKQKQEPPAATASLPPLPPRSTLRASKFLDSFELNLTKPSQTAKISQATPHDFYLSSEEDPSSSADDFSDYDYESGSEEPDSPVRQKSREDTARVVSVIFSGKPSLIDLSSIRRSISPGTAPAGKRIANSAEDLQNRYSTAYSVSSVSSALPPRKSSMFDSILSRQKPSFLKIDPYANGSTYSLAAGRQTSEDEDPSRTPKSPLMLSRTLSLVKKRSRPSLANAKAAAVSTEDLRATTNERAASMPRKEEASVVLGPVQTTNNSSSVFAARQSRKMSVSDVMQVVKRNIRNVPHPPANLYDEPPMPPLPAPAQAPASAAPPVQPRGLLGNFSSRRRSIKGTSRLLE